ncbi:amino acid adenylation domain-containing protein [Sphaerisporangium sp. NBC_01403]|uniref:amino acid adenylation domain-containing protein n=1 Tax=Sphaerisporangium sp. NBC_01403 TaxID=2903599 RepID=UPI00324B39DF
MGTLAHGEIIARPAGLGDPPLSYGQERMWFLSRLEGSGGAAYNVFLAHRLRGPLDAGALERAIAEIVARHEVLRTRYPAKDGDPVQVIDPPPSPADAGVGGDWLEVVDLAEVPVDGREARAKAMAAERVARRFDLAGEYPFRASLLRLSEREHVLCVVFHHIAVDGWSSQIFFRELAALYGTYVNAGTPDLPPPPLQYADFALWQRERLGEVLDGQLGYWRERLDGAPTLELPTDRPRPPVTTSSGGSVNRLLPASLSKKIDELARRTRGTRFMTLMAAYQALLARYSGQEDICVGTPVAGRGTPELEPLIGLFINTLVFRVDLSGDPTFRELLTRVRTSALEAYSNDALPFDRLVSELNLPRDLSRTPLFQAQLILYNYAESLPPLPGLTTEPFDPGVRLATFDLSAEFRQDEDGLRLSLVYNADLFDRETVERMAGHFEALLIEATEDPGRRLSDLDLLDVVERERLLLQWNDTAAPRPDVTLPELVAGRPGATAVTFEGRTLTYAELEASANRLAHRLRREGVRPGVLVALCANRSPETLVALLAVMKAGGAYLPLDPEYPRDRLAFVLADSGAELLLTEERLRDRLPECDVPALLIEDPAAFAAEPASAPEPTATPADLAYVIYTSGSTGRPKGVAIEHRALVNLLLSMKELLGSGPGHLWLALTSLSFDISGLELFLPLVSGGHVLIAGTREAADPLALARLAAAYAVTHVQATPSGWQAMLDAGFDRPSVTALVGGEALPPVLARALRGRVRDLWNVYGPTETTIWSTCERVPVEPDTVTIGGPLANTQVYVLDERLRPVPAGVPGELFIAGAGVARGYLRRPALTAERFVPDPFGPSGSRLYRTGDRVRWLADGRISFLGRADGQVKLRGHRVELGEVEAVLATCPGVRRAVAAIHADTLVAYVVTDAAGDTASDTGDTPGYAGDAVGYAAGVRAHVARSLPAVMVPAVVVSLPALPMTPNGKIDRNALPAPDRRPTGLGRPPRTPLEHRVAEVFGEVLKAGPLGADDDFFLLGGHSLLAVKVTARMTAALGVQIPLRDLFAHPTVSGYASAVQDRSEAGGALPRRRPDDGTPPPLSPAQERLWFLHRLDRGDAAYNMYLVWRLRGALDAEALTGALRDLAERHDTLRTRYPERDGGPVAVVEPAGGPAVEHIILGGNTHGGNDGNVYCGSVHDGNILGGSEEEAGRIVAERTNAPFDLAAAAPLRVTLIRLADDDHVLCVVLHHIAGDGWSLTILGDDLARLYSARTQGTDAALPELPLRYGDVAHWRRGRDDGAALAYWRERLAGPPVLELPTDHPRPEVSGHRGGFHAFALPAKLADGLEHIARERGATLFMVLLAAYQVLLSRHSGQTDILVGSPSAGRDHVEFEGLVGYFADTLVLRGDLSGDTSFTSLLDRTRATVLAALAHQDVPFEKLLTELDVPRDLSRTPLFQTMAILHSQDEGAARTALGDLDLEWFDAGYRQVKFDLMLEAWRRPEGLSLVLGYDAELFDESAIAGLAARFTLLCRAIVSDPGRAISALPMLTPGDETRLRALEEVTVSGEPQPDGAPQAGTGTSGILVPGMIEAVTVSLPGATAVSCGGETLTYADLDRRVASLAHRLRERGVGRESVVGVHVDRSADAVVALLAVWRARGAYLPLDPELPAERIGLLIADSDAAVVVTRTHLAHLLPSNTPLLVIEETRNSHTQHPNAATKTDSTASGAHPEPDCTAVSGEREGGDAAYVIYTSGSTGAPKGVVVEHRALAARVEWMKRAYALGPGDRVVQFASLSFDTHAEEIYPALAAGATVELLPGGALTLPELLAGPRGREVTVLDLPTAYWHQLVDQLDRVAWPDALRLVILGGEQAHAAAVARWRERFGDRVRLVNTYGPTEATIIATATDLGAADTTGRPPIGRPIGATRAVVLDGHGRRVPPGAPGELHLGGAGLARGYLGRPELTAERFVTRPGEGRLYRTGDLVRWRADGRLEFLGRLDDQMKVRGFRIEPAEIEGRLLAHPGVRQAAVVARDGTLVAYVAGPAGPDPGQPLDPVVLRRELAASLPSYMVPEVWVVLDALPLTPGGKVDRRALPPPDPGDGRPFTAPRTDAEALVAEIWQEVLGAGEVGAFDDFFALGGHSLLAVQVGSRLRATTGVEVPIRALFTHRTVADLAAEVERVLTEELAELSDEEAARLLEGEAP